MPLWLLTGLAGVRKAIAGLFALIARYPWQSVCIALLLASGWLWHGWDGALADLKTCTDGRKADQVQRNAQVAAAKAATAAAKQKGKDASDDAETYHAQLQADGGKLRDYIVAHRVPAARPATPASPGSRIYPAVPSDTPAVPAVAVPASVINTCEADYTYAAGAFRLGQELIAKGLATPAPASPRQPQ
jgi:hypothetical protein